MAIVASILLRTRSAGLGVDATPWAPAVTAQRRDRPVRNERVAESDIEYSKLDLGGYIDHTTSPSGRKALQSPADGLFCSGC
jgi:hypothetical protein